MTSTGSERDADSRLDDATVAWAARYLDETERDRLAPVIAELLEARPDTDLLCLIGADQNGERGLLAIDSTHLLFCPSGGDDLAEEPLLSIERIAFDPLRCVLSIASDDGYETAFSGFSDPAAAEWFAEVLEAALTDPTHAADLAARPPGHSPGPEVGLEKLGATAAPSELISFTGADALGDPGILAVSDSALLFWNSIADQVTTKPLEQVVTVTADPLRGTITAACRDGSQVAFGSLGDGVTTEWFCSVVEATIRSPDEALHIAADPPGTIPPIGMLWEREQGAAGWQLWLEPASYLGGHPQRSDPIKRAMVWLNDVGVVIYDSHGRTGLEFNLDELRAIEVDGPNEVRKRVTFTRILALGVLALAIPKKERLSYLVLETREGEAIVEVHSMSAMELRAALQPLTKVVAGATDGAASTSQPDPPRSVRDRLIELKELHSDGLIDDRELAERRAAILGEV